jgi:mono/diheme cytochrome c family protein
MRLASLPTAVILLACSYAASAQSPVRQGRALMQQFCARCHAIGGTGKSRHADAPPFRYLGRSFDLDQFARLLERGISSGHPDMPEFKFTEDDANAARAYLRTIQE